LASSATAPWAIERLARHHERTAFDCGIAALDDWLRLRASQYEKKDLARTYVAVRGAAAAVLGYYAIATHRVGYEALADDQAKGLPRIDIPVILLGKPAVDRQAQGQGLGALLLIDALRRAAHLADTVGIRAVEVDAIDEAARRFYKKFGFVSLLDDENHLFLPMHIIRKLNLPLLGKP
jgi:GNAT superfamily N-acetyltransferase